MLKFPHTPHLMWLAAGQPRADKVLTEQEADSLLANPLIVEEKVDGANIGISVAPPEALVVQNRGTILGPSAHPQFAPLWPWLAQRRLALIRALGDHLTLYGEWCFAVHSVAYSALPDYFLAFDVYDRTVDRFFSTLRRNEFCAQLGISTVPTVARGVQTRSSLLGMMGKSEFSSEMAEGLYLRQEDDRHLVCRAKLVRAEFVQSIEEHWMKRPMVRNRLAPLQKSS